MTAVQWILYEGVIPTLKNTTKEKDTALHKALICLQETCPQNPGKIFEVSFDPEVMFDL